MVDISRLIIIVVLIIIMMIRIRRYIVTRRESERQTPMRRSETDCWKKKQYLSFQFDHHDQLITSNHYCSTAVVMTIIINGPHAALWAAGLDWIVRLYYSFG